MLIFWNYSIIFKLQLAVCLVFYIYYNLQSICIYRTFKPEKTIILFREEKTLQSGILYISIPAVWYSIIYITTCSLILYTYYYLQSGILYILLPVVWYSIHIILPTVWYFVYITTSTCSLAKCISVRCMVTPMILVPDLHSTRSQIIFFFVIRWTFSMNTPLMSLLFVTIYKLYCLFRGLCWYQR